MRAFFSFFFIKKLRHSLATDTRHTVCLCFLPRLTKKYWFIEDFSDCSRGY